MWSTDAMTCTFCMWARLARADCTADSRTIGPSILCTNINSTSSEKQKHLWSLATILNHNNRGSNIVIGRMRYSHVLPLCYGNRGCINRMIIVVSLSYRFVLPVYNWPEIPGLIYYQVWSSSRIIMKGLIMK